MTENDELEAVFTPEVLTALLRNVRKRKKEVRRSNPKQLEILWTLNPNCFWCGRETILEHYHHPLSATKDHLYIKGDPRRVVDGSWVLSCEECNTIRGSYDNIRKMTSEGKVIKPYMGKKNKFIYYLDIWDDDGGMCYGKF